jgi:hypothetical protein
MQSLLHPPRAQRGYAMLGAVALIGLFAATAITTQLGAEALGNRQNNTTATALALAKQALISRAASDGNHPGSLPCPDAVTNIAGTNIPNDGIADLLAGSACPQHIGRLPWRTLGLPDLRDADGERLWYMVAPAYHDSPTKIINAGTSGQLNAYDCADSPATTPAWPCDAPRLVSVTPWVAVVFSAGATVATQLRSGATANDPAQFLESYNAADPWRLRISATDTYNDRAAAITADDVHAQVQRRIAAELQSVLSKYVAITAAQGTPSLPWPAANCVSSTQCNATSLSAPLPAIALGYLPSDDVVLNQLMTAQNMAWFDHNHWRTAFAYAIDAQCGNGGSAALCGRNFADAAASLIPVGAIIVGGQSNALAPDTRGLLTFGGVAAGTGKSRIAIAIH